MQEPQLRTTQDSLPTPGIGEMPVVEQVQTKRKMVYYPDSVLRTKCVEVTKFDEDLLGLTLDLRAWMERRPSLGLAAPQLGDNRRVLAFKVGDRQDVMVNPTFEVIDPTQVVEPEGCLSFPGFTVKVPRSQHIYVKYQDCYGNQVGMNAQGLLAVVIQHEIDHLDGKLFIDYMSPIQRDITTRKYKKVMKQIQRNSQTYGSIENLLKFMKEKK